MQRLLASILLFMGSLSSIAGSASFAINHGELVKEKQEYRLNADFALNFSDVVIDVLKNGVPLKIDVITKIDKHRKYLWDETMVEAVISYRIRYHALAELFQVTDPINGKRQNFVTLESAIESMAAVRGLPVTDAEAIGDDAPYRVKLKLELDFEALPLALRPTAYLSSEWYLDSEWYTWSLER